MIMSSLLALALAASPAIPVADGAPTFDITSICKAATPDSAASTQACIDDEQKARDTLKDQWSKYAARDRAQCSQTAGMAGMPSYVEILTCLEMAKDARELPADITGSGVPNR
jgi:hypothetical protein